MVPKERIVSTYQAKSYSGPLLPDNYRNLIKVKWMKSLRFGNDYMKLTDSDAYFSAYDLYLSGLLNDGDTRVTLAVLSDEPDVVLGFSCWGEDVLHYVWVGKDFRLQGIGKYLLSGGFHTFSHLTKVVLKLWPKKFPNAIFDPFQ